jgi:hypothetical protein
MSDVLLTMYAVRNRDGQFFRAKGYGGSGDTWVDSLKKARLYSKVGPARAQVTYFANKYPQYGIPELIELWVTDGGVLNEEDRVKKSQDRQAKQKARWEKSLAEYNRKQAEKKLAEAQETLSRLGMLK